MIRLILVDDHALVRDGMTRLLEAQPDMRVAGSFGEGEAAVRFAGREEPDVAIVDIAMPGANGIEITRRLRDASPETGVLVLSMHSNPEYVHRALLAGALGYVAKESAGPVLVEAIRAVHAGRRYLSDTVRQGGVERHEAGLGERGLLGALSAREQQVLRHTVEGKTIAQTATLIGVSPKSVETYRSRIMTKLGIVDLPGLVKFAIRNGITTV
jgi:DNA-binding NarL/FixJ family response regulator